MGEKYAKNTQKLAGEVREAEAAEEDLKSGKKRMTPYWRVVKADGSLYQKFPGGKKHRQYTLNFVTEKTQ